MSHNAPSSPALPSLFSKKGVFIGRYFSIEFYLHPSWFFIFALVVYELSSDVFPHALSNYPPAVYRVMGTTAAILFFLSILLHELGHSLVSQRCGISVPRITLYLIGGLAEISREPDDARSELKIALGGPLVSVVLIGIYSVGWWLFGLAVWPAAALICKWLAWTNFTLVLFNMIPGYPLDGGRVLRALLWQRTGRLRRATYIASRIGIGFSWFLIFGGVYMMAVAHQPTGIILCVIAFFLKNAAESGYSNALQREVLAGVRVQDIMTPNPAWIPVTMPLNLAVDEFFLANHHVAFPVCGDDLEFRGLLRLEFLKDVPRERWPYTTAGEVVADRQASKLSIDADTSAARAMRLLLGPGMGRLAVLRAGRMIGIITRHDILHFIEIHTELEG